VQLEMGTFPVASIEFAEETAWDDGNLRINREELLGLILRQGDLEWADIDITSPGDSVRLVNLKDLYEIKSKVDGPGTVYPGVFGRSVETVGQGRTHRMGGVAVGLLVDDEHLTAGERAWPHEGGNQKKSEQSRTHARFIDMSGPGNLSPYNSLNLLCLTIYAPADLNHEDRYTALRTAVLRVIDRLAETIADQTAPESEVFNTDVENPDLPGYVFIPHLASGEWQAEAGPRSNFGAAIYGQTRLSSPWMLYPTEMMDGAVMGTYMLGRPASWQLSNSPIVAELSRRHGKTCNFLGCLIQRTNWTTQPEKEMAAERAALMAKRLGAAGAIVTTDLRGQRFLETALTVQACERQGIDTILLTEEEDNEFGTAPPLLVSFPEVTSIVSSGTGGVEEPFPAVERVIGSRDPSDEWLQELPAIHGSYGSSYLADYYGFGYNSFEDF
jgi:glycine reductase